MWQCGNVAGGQAGQVVHEETRENPQDRRDFLMYPRAQRGL